MSILKLDNLQLGYKESGANPAQTPLIFLHGVGSDKSVWREQLEFFASSRRTIAFDYPGYGESSLPENDLTRGAIAEILLSALAVLQIEAAHFCGLSMGGIIALEIYAQRPDAVQSLILANTFAKHPDGGAIVERTLQFVAANSMRDFAAQRVENLLAPQTSAAIRHNVVETMARIDKKSYAWASRAVWEADYLNALPQISVPTLVIGADSDKPTPPELARELAANIPRAELEIITNAGHLSNLDQPEKFNSIIENFLERYERTQN